jgi:hypothetical protein
MKHNLVKVSLTILLLAVSFAFASAKANFTGTWVMDRSKSQGVPDGVEQTMTLTQTGDTLTLENKIVSPQQGELTIKDSYNINGKETEVSQQRNETVVKGKRTSTWSADGNGFDSVDDLTFETADGQKVTQHITRKWVMAADGKSFTVDMHNKGPNGEQTTKRTFVKK